MYQHQHEQLFPNIFQYKKKIKHQCKQLFFIIYQHQRKKLFPNIFQYK